MATIADVARQAGVAPSTVSHALSGKRPVAAATRERIITAARALGYEPNATAGNVRVRRACTVGLSLLLDRPGRTLSPGPFAEYVVAIADLLAAHDDKLPCLVARSPDVSDLARLVRGSHLDGLNGQRPACCGHLIPMHLTARGPTGRLEPARGAANHTARGEGGPSAWREKGGQQRTVLRSASGCHGLSSRHHR